MDRNGQKQTEIDRTNTNGQIWTDKVRNKEKRTETEQNIQKLT